MRNAVFAVLQTAVVFAAVLAAFIFVAEMIYGPPVDRPAVMNMAGR